MPAAERTDARATAAGIARDVGAIIGLAGERVALAIAASRTRRAPAEGTPDRRARDIRWCATWTAAAVGAVATLPPDPVLGVVASTIEAGLLANIEACASTRILALAEVGEELAVASIGTSGAARAMVRAGTRRVASVAMEHILGVAAKAAAKDLGLALPRLALRAVVGSAAPIMGAAWGGLWNALYMHRRLTPAVDAVERRTGAAALRTAPIDVGEIASPSPWGLQPELAA